MPISHEIKKPAGMFQEDADARYLKLDQTAAQDVINGRPTIQGGEVVNKVAPPAGPSSVGVLGQIAEDDDYLYICIATDTWKRVQIDTWIAVETYLLMEDDNFLLTEDDGKLVLEV